MRGASAWLWFRFRLFGTLGDPLSQGVRFDVSELRLGRHRHRPPLARSACANAGGEFGNTIRLPFVFGSDILIRRAEPFAAHPHVLVTAPQHRFATAESVPAAALAREGFIVREPGSSTRSALEQYLAEFRLEPLFIMEMNSTEAIKQAVMAGMGVSLISLHTIGLEWRNGLIAAPNVEGLPLMRRWHVVNTAAKLLSPAAEAFRYFMLERGEAHLAEMFGSDAGFI